MNMEKQMKVKRLLFIILFLLIGCSSHNPPVETPPEEVKFTYKIKENLIFTEGDVLDFSDVVAGNFDSFEVSDINQDVGNHLLRVTLFKNDQKQVIAVPYQILEKGPSSNYYLKELTVDGYSLTPEFTPENDTYTLDIDESVTSFNVLATPLDHRSTIISGIGEVVSYGNSFEHYVLVEAENQEQWYYIINVVVSPVEQEWQAETYNGYYINYPNSQPAVLRDDLLTVVNKEFRLEPSFVPSNLVMIDQNYQLYGNAALISEAHDAYLQMRQAASTQGLALNVSTCYRGYDFQRTLYTNYLNNDTQEVVDTYSARPGHSEHQLGVACDFVAGHLELGNFTNTAEDYWMRENAADYGFILRFPEDKTDITGYMYESWHYRYVGIDSALKIKQSGLTLEEYLGY